jgi:hypothetical protein
MIVPTLATVVVGTVGIVQNNGQANQADQARALSVLAAQASGLVHELQNERAAAVFVLNNKGADAKKNYENQASQTQKRVSSYQAARRADLSGLPDELLDRIGRIDRSLDELSRTEKQILNGPAMPLSVSTIRYNTLISDLLGVRDSMPELSGAEDLASDMRATAALSRYKEHISRERAYILAALIRRLMSSTVRREYELAEMGQESEYETFTSSANTWQRQQYNRNVVGSYLADAYRYHGEIGKEIERLLELGELDNNNQVLAQDLFTAEKWDEAFAEKSDLLRKVEESLDQRVTSDVGAAHKTLRERVLIETGVLIAMLLLAILFAWMVARSMAQSVRELRLGALHLAQYGLPQAVARLRDPALIAQGAPHKIAEQIAEPLPIRSRDEFGQLAEAFNAVHLEAVRSAAEQAALRSSVATMFVNLARRSQILVDRLIGHLDRLERGEEDPDRLGELFQLDHLATRMRRNDENLLVLAGADSSRIQRDAAPLMDVLRAAQSEVEHYTRIEFGTIDGDIEVAAHAVNDLVHLVAELFDNATAFSPPDSSVIVEARRLGDRAALLVEDRGIGISREQLGELNERLANPPVVDVAVSRMMGLVVVARLGARHGVKVELRAARERGTIADLTLPTSVLVPRALGGGRGGPGSPLALESGAPPIPGQPMETAPFGFGPVPGGKPSGAFNGGSPFFNGEQPGASSGIGSAFGNRPSSNGSAASQRGPFAASEPPQPATSSLPVIPQPPVSQVPHPGVSAPPMPATIPPQAPVSPPAPQGRNLPAWSDLTGANQISPRPQPPAAPPPAFGGTENLPHRRGGDLWNTGDGDAETSVFPAQTPPADQTGQIPRQRTQIPPRPRTFGGPQSAPDAVTSAPPAAPAPPAWPPSPVTPEREAPAGTDLTTEIPAIRMDWESVADPAMPMAGGTGGAQPEQRYVDETMELPIYRELESAWFRTSREVPTVPPAQVVPAQAKGPERTVQVPAPPVPAPPVPAPPIPAPPVPAPAPRRETEEPRAMPTRFGGLRSGDIDTVDTTQSTSGFTSGGASIGAQVSAGRSAAAQAPSWQTAADEGWQAAAALAREQDFAMTETGLPKRVPMSQLVPGGVERTSAASLRRTPEAVRGLLSAYHRGVQRGRSQQSGRTPDVMGGSETMTGPHNSQGGNSQGGKEYEA